MTDIMKRKFVALEISGKNYMTWVLDAGIHLDAMGLGDAIKDKTKASTQDCAKALIFLHHHLDEGLKIEYLTVKDPLALLNGLKERYDNLKLVTLPQARYDWTHLRLQDFKSVSEYSSAMFRITSKLKLCGDTITDYDMFEKTFTTFHASNMWKGKDEKPKANGSETECYCCGGKGHWANICRVPRHLVELYQVSLKNKGFEANFVSDNDFDVTHLDVADFFERPDGKIDHMIGDGSVVKED
ncbi:uncharacterized protein [Nicotiana sylvestris]|uniref:uncharacterized protein n=1 Tax=Nicotiana sylvestris TaxID=4096 RepID=UPI00388CCA7B